MSQMQKRIGIFLVPGVLLIIVAMQFEKAFYKGLTPWKGGGFGMFSTVDSVGARFAEIWLVTAEGKYPVSVPEVLDAAYVKARTYPTYENVGLMHKGLLDLKWFVVGKREVRFSESDQKISDAMTGQNVVARKSAPKEYEKELDVQEILLYFYKYNYSIRTKKMEKVRLTSVAGGKNG